MFADHSDFERNARQQDLIGGMRHIQANVIGVGAIGRQVALSLAAIGVKRLKLVDPDVVEEANLGTQMFKEDDLNQPKVEGVADACHALNSKQEIETHARRFQRADAACGELFAATFMCVDSMKSREFIWKALAEKGDFALAIDTRMAAETLRLVTVEPRHDNDFYRQTLFSDDDALQERCTARATVYCAMIAAGLAVSRLTLKMRGITSTPQDTQLTLASLTAVDPALAAEKWDQ